MTTAKTGVHPNLEPIKRPLVELRDFYGRIQLSPEKLQKINDDADWELRHPEKDQPQPEESES